jgi:micrococcal nuclease
MKYKTWVIGIIGVFLIACDNPNSAAGTSLYRVHLEALTKTADGEIARMLPAEVIRHLDGDTVRVGISNPPPELAIEETVRMIGVDTPETVHPNKPIQEFGKEASAFTKEQLLDKQVYLAFDWDLRDRYGRLLAYIYTEDGTCFNTRLIREGYAYAYLYFDFQFIEEFEELEQSAKKHGLGLWGL